MSQVKIQGNASGTGIFTVAAPNSNTDRTLTLPDGAGTLDRLERAGNVLQVVNATTDAETSTTGTTLVDTYLTASITPSSANSKILVFASINAYKATGNLDNGIKLALIRNGSSIVGSYFVAYGLWTFTDTRNRAGYSVTKLDSPSSTSSVTYKIQIASQISGVGVGINHDSSTSSITLMEIAG